MDPNAVALPERLSFTVFPALDPGAAGDRRIVVSDDEWNTGALIVIPLAVAQADIAYIHALAHSMTLGALREHAIAWAVAAERYDETSGEPGGADLLPDDTDYNADTRGGSNFCGTRRLGPSDQLSTGSGTKISIARGGTEGDWPSW